MRTYVGVYVHDGKVWREVEGGEVTGAMTAKEILELLHDLISAIKASLAKRRL